MKALHSSARQGFGMRTLVCAVVVALISGCNQNPSKRSSQVYHAPKQSFDLTLKSPAVIGLPKLKHRCSTESQTVEMVDDLGNYYRIDVLNTPLIEQIELTEDKKESAYQITEFYRNLYNSPFELAPTFRLRAGTESMLYFPLPLDRPGPVAEDGRVMGIMAFKRGDHLYTLQHLQNYYNQQLMLTKLKSLYGSMQIPGLFPSEPDPSAEDQPILGLIELDPAKAAESEQFTKWNETSRCSGK